MKILVTGGAGYIGSHTCIELLAGGHDVVVVDDLSNSEADVIDRIGRIAGRAPAFVEGDIRDAAAMAALFGAHRFDAVIHFAGLKAVGESVAAPLRYYDVNVHGSVVLFQTMQQHNVKTLIFSSSATVYGDPATTPIVEDFPLQTTNPYGASKLMIENILRDLAVAEPDWRIGLLRYFNPVGAHESGLIGENPRGIPNNLLPFIAQVAEGRRERLSVFGDDYPTPDGTGMRDYIHVVDLAVGHVKALERLAAAPGVLTYNLGTGKASSVLDMVRAFERASGRPIPYAIMPRRAGDIPICYAATGLAERELGWKAERDVNQMCVDTWRWQSSLIK
ncbi:UDP-glucose 4-epimerase GalE [Oxalobacteraceae bacterium OTU3CINTB1]|nr:UDP-glucose 4-epimerase GalE [Oxalobacteraceae bacterium OTU3CINTB1]